VVIDLAAIRRAAGVTQVQLAERLRLRQGQISRTEHQADLLLSTLIAYFRALGVGAELTVTLPGGETIHQILIDRIKDAS
jgi:transcriptional regulator with XRE-family HTH domain